MPKQGRISEEINDKEKQDINENFSEESRKKVNLDKESGLVEAVLFLESEPVTVEVLSNISQLAPDVVEECLDMLKEKYSSENSGVELVMITGGWALTPKKEFWDVLKEKYGNKNEGRLSRSALETLTIIAYKQPITRAEIENIRGVPPDNMIRTLVERQFIKDVGKKDAPGRPTQFGTTKEFLKFFRLNSIADLPKLDEKQEEKFILAR